MLRRCSSVLVLVLLIVLAISNYTWAVRTLPLKKGMTGSDVLEVQKMLFEIGLDVECDASFDLDTVNAVKDFQRSQGINPDGIIGQSTYLKLKALCADIQYIVKQGDTLSGIAEQFNVAISDLKVANKLQSNLIKKGQILKIPHRGIGDGPQEQLSKTTVHVVRSGDVLGSIASRYGVSVASIKSASNLQSDRLQVGQKLRISYTKPTPPKVFRLVKGAFIWPTIGRISSGFGYRIHPIFKYRHFHGGIDISVSYGSPIVAAASGKVVRAGWLDGFGKAVVLDHGNGVTTLYAHNSRLLVSVGDTVRVGQLVAKAGSTGQSTGPHLDFRVMLNEKPVNPMYYLP